jgi:hypothetical protein
MRLKLPSPLPAPAQIKQSVSYTCHYFNNESYALFPPKEARCVCT